MCKRADMLLKKRNVQYEVIDAEEDEQGVDFYGIQSVPCLVDTVRLYSDEYRICRTPQSEHVLEEFLEAAKGL